MRSVEILCIVDIMHSSTGGGKLSGHVGGKYSIISPHNFVVFIPTDEGFLSLVASERHLYMQVEG